MLAVLSNRKSWVVLAGVLAGLLAAGAGLWLWLGGRAAYSNIHPQDYVGPDACVACHEQNHQDNFDSWQAHSHRVMNQDATEESVKGDFSDARLDYGGRSVVFHRGGPRYLMSIYENDTLRRRIEVTRTVGSMYVQYYVGKQVRGPEPRRHRTYHIESKLKFGYSIELARWLPEPYFDSTVPPEREFQAGGSRAAALYAAPTHRWNSSCLICHNTYAYERRLLIRGSWRAGYPKESVEWRGGAEYGGDQELKASNRVTLPRELVTVGISCESCHFGGREHAIEKREIRFVPTSPMLTIRHPDSGRPAESDRDDPFVVNSICAQCHTAELDVYPNGSPAVNSGESLALAGGACASVIKCTDCHSPHEKGPRSGSPVRESDLQACLNCHAQFEAALDRTKHTQHSDGVTCLDCHMPRTVAGLDTVVRSHRISKPIDAQMIESASLNACNLCHLDQSITWTLSQLEAKWKVKLPQPAVVKGSGDHAMAEVWAQSPSQFVRAAALEAAVRSPHVRDRIAPLMRGLEDEYPFNRTLALVALQRHLNRRVSEEEFDLLADAETRAHQTAALERSLRAAGW